jgi:hypothetical protein
VHSNVLNDDVEPVREFNVFKNIIVGLMAWCAFVV